MQPKSVLAPKITTHYLEYDNMKYFRENSTVVEICSYGEKKDPVGARAYLDVRGKIKRDTLAGKVGFVTSVAVDWQETSSGDIGLNLSLPVFGLTGAGAANYSYEKAKSAKLKLMYFEVSEVALLKMLNNEADGARKFLAEEGNDGRVCSGIWLWAEAELVEEFTSAGSVTASVSGGSSSLSITATGGKHGTTTITPLPGSTAAYKLHKVKSWTDRHKTKIEEIESDFKGNG
jgi:hypothetical protein